MYNEKLYDMGCVSCNQEYDELDVLHAQGKYMLVTFLLENCMVQWDTGNNTRRIKTDYRGIVCEYVNLIQNGVRDTFSVSIDQCSDYTKQGIPRCVE
jgi:hypothetical protein